MLRDPRTNTNGNEPAKRGSSLPNEFAPDAYRTEAREPANSLVRASGKCLSVSTSAFCQPAPRKQESNS